MLPHLFPLAKVAASNLLTQIARYLSLNFYEIDVDCRFPTAVRQGKRKDAQMYYRR